MKRIIIMILTFGLLSLSACSSSLSDLPEQTEGTMPQDASIEALQNTPSSDVTKTETTMEDTEQTLPAQTDDSTIKVIIAVAMKNYQQRELWPVYNTFEAEGFDITVAGSEIGTAADGGDSIETEEEFSGLDGKDFDGIVIIGGSGVKTLWDNQALLKLINQVYESGGVAAAICLAPLTLANAGVLKEDDSACWYSSADINTKMKALGIIDTKQDVTVCGRIVTGNGPDAAKQFADEVALALNSTD